MTWNTVRGLRERSEWSPYMISRERARCSPFHMICRTRERARRGKSTGGWAGSRVGARAPTASPSPWCQRAPRASRARFGRRGRARRSGVRDPSQHRPLDRDPSPPLCWGDADCVQQMLSIQRLGHVLNCKFKCSRGPATSSNRRSVCVVVHGCLPVS